MSSKLFPSTGEKPKFNPNEPYEAVQDHAVPSQKKPKFNPNEPYEEAGNTMPAQKAFEVKIFDPTFKSAPVAITARTFSDQKPYDEYGVVKKLQKEALSAKSKIDLELRSNDTQYEKRVREVRRDAFTMDDLKKEAKQKNYIIPIGQEKEILRLAKERQYNLPVTQDDISDIKTGTIINPNFSRQFIKELDNPEVQKQAYYVDAYNHALNDIDGERRVSKIKENAEKIGRGEYTYDPVNKLLGKPEGFIKSVLSGRDDLNRSFDLYNYIKEAPDASVIDRLNTELMGDIDEPVPIPGGKRAEVGRMMGAQPLKGLLGGGVVAAAATYAGHPEHAATAFNVVNAGLSAADMYKIGLANAVKANYALFKQQGLSDNEALQKAKVLGESQANMDAASAALMSFAAGKLAFKPSSLNLLRKPLANALGQIGEDLAKKSIEGAGVGTIGGVTQILKNIQAQREGLPVETTEGFKEQLEAGTMLTAATHIIAKSSSLVKPSTLNKIKKIVSTAPKEVVDQNINSQVEAGHITSEEAKSAQSEIDDTRTMNSMIRNDIPESDRDKIAVKIKERNELKKRLETEDELYHPEIKEKIKKLNEEALAISHGSQRSDLRSLITKEVNAGNVEESASKVLMSATSKELDGIMKDIAIHADNPITEQMTISAFGKEIVNKAKELYSEKNKQQDATNVRGDEGQVPLTGNGSEGSQEQSSSNIQLEESTQPIVAEAQQQAGNKEQQQGAIQGEEVKPSGMEGGIPPNMGDLPFEPELSDVTRLAHADTEEIYSKLGLVDRIPRATKDDLRLENEADQLIKSGYDFEGKADRVISGREKSFTDAEQVAFAKIVGALNVKLEKLDPNSPEFNSTLETIERLSRASDIVGSEAGAAFRARRMFMLNDETLSSFMQKAKEANLDVPLTEEQASAVKARYDDIKASRDAYRARLEKLAEEYSKLKSEKNFKKAASSTGKQKRTHEEYQKEREDIIAQMREKLKKSRGDTSVTIVPYAKELIAIAPEVGKLLKSLAAEGVDKLEDAVKSIHQQVKEMIPQVTEKDIHNIIAGEYSNKQTKNDLQEKIYEMRLQARLINRLEELQSGVQPKTKSAKLKRSAEIEELRKQIKELTGRSDESKLASLKSRYKNQIDALQKKIDEGDFEPDVREEIELDKEAIDLKDAYIKKKIEWQKAVAKDKFNNRSLKQKGKDLAIEVLGIPRTVMSSMDLSAPLRQGLVLTTTHPVVASKAFIESLRQAVDPARFDRWLFDLKESDYYKNVIEKSGLYVADPNNLSLSAKEEAYMSNLAEKIPVVGDAIKNKKGKTILPGLGLISKSERAYVSYLNKLRVDVFTMYATGLAEKGITPETRPDVYEALGAFVNAATGRGELGDLERSAPILNALFFSPRLIASRLNMLNPVWYASLPKEVRQMALGDMAKMIGIGATTVGLLSLVPGVTVEKDPRSPDFGKAKAGNTRWDVWGGFQQYVRLASQLFSGYEKKANGNIVPLGPGRNQHTRADKFFSFFRGKLSPIPSMAIDFGTGKTAVGEDVTLTNEMKEHLIPMIGNDVAEAWKEQGPMSIVYTGVPSFFGVGTTTYKEREPKSEKTKGAHHNQKKNKKTKKDG